MAKKPAKQRNTSKLAELIEGVEAPETFVEAARKIFTLPKSKVDEILKKKKK